MKALALLAGAAVLLAGALACADEKPVVRIGSKRFTESLILGEIGRLAAEQAGEARAEHKEGLGGTAIVYRALEEGSIDAYPEYTGTIAEAILKDPKVQSAPDMRRALEARGMGMSGPLGFENTYALAAPRVLAQKLGLVKISDLAAHPDIPIGLSHEFLGRSDGWPGLAKHYGLSMEHVSGLDHGLSYEAVAKGSIAILDIYSTDAKIERYDLTTLADDRGFFPSYQAVWLYRADLPSRLPKTFAALAKLEGRIDARTMILLNARVELSDERPSDTAARFVDGLSGGGPKAAPSAVVPGGFWAGMLDVVRTEGPAHLWLVGLSLLASVLAGVPLGVAAAKLRRAGGPILAATGVVQTIPALALLCFFIPLLGIGKLPALAALFLYGLLPIVRNTATGLRSIPQSLLESAEALGLPRSARLFRVELPLASRTILAGVKTSAVINVGTATVAAFVGAGGLGSPISTGLNLNDTSRILQGAVPAAALALLVQGGFALLERAVVPKGLSA